MTNSKHIGNRILEARKKINLSQAKMAEKISISPQAIGKWERGESMPDITMLDRLAELFGVDLNYFSENSGRIPSEIGLTGDSVLQNVKSQGALSEKELNRKKDMTQGSWVDADFSGLKHLKEKFDQSNLKNCKFIASDLSGLTFNNNYIDGCDFSQADLRNCQLKSSQIIKNTFTACSLIDAVFEKSEVRNCDLSKANFSGTLFLSTSFLGNNMDLALLKHADFKGSTIADIVFRGTLEDCSFENCGFKNVKFENVTIKNTFFKHNRKLNKVEFIDCKVDKLTYAFLKSDGAITDGIIIIE